jgi:hypothetical protein
MLRTFAASVARHSVAVNTWPTTSTHLAALVAGIHSFPSYETILVQRCEQHAVVELNRPQALNALSSQVIFMQELLVQAKDTLHSHAGTNFVCNTRS